MAIYFLRVQTVRRAAGRSIVAAAAYRAGQRITDDRTGQAFDYSRRRGVVASGLVGWEGGREALWNAAEAAEKRRDAVVGREVLVALPHSLPRAEQEALLVRLSGWLQRRHKVAVDWCMHFPDPEGDGRNWHGHILLTARRVEGGRLGAKTLELDRRPASRQAVEALRRAWAGMVNDALARDGQSGRVDGRSHARQAAAKGIQPQLPMLTIGPQAHRLARRGHKLDVIVENGRRVATNALQAGLGFLENAILEDSPRGRSEFIR